MNMQKAIERAINRRKVGTKISVTTLMNRSGLTKHQVYTRASKYNLGSITKGYLTIAALRA